MHSASERTFISGALEILRGPCYPAREGDASSKLSCVRARGFGTKDKNGFMGCQVGFVITSATQLCGYVEALAMDLRTHGVIYGINRVARARRMGIKTRRIYHLSLCDLSSANILDL